MNLEDEKSWSFFMPQVKLSLLAGILLQQPPGLGGCLSEAKAGGSYYSCKSEINQKEQVPMNLRRTSPNS